MCGDMEKCRTRPLVNDVDLPPSISQYRSKSVATLPNRDVFNSIHRPTMSEKITIRKRPQSEAVVTQHKFFKKTARGKVIKGENGVSHPVFLLILC